MPVIDMLVILSYGFVILLKYHHYVYGKQGESARVMVILDKNGKIGFQPQSHRGKNKYNTDLLGM